MRPPGYEPDELPTALSRDIGLQIYELILKMQVFPANKAVPENNLNICTFVYGKDFKNISGQSAGKPYQ